MNSISLTSIEIPDVAVEDALEQIRREIDVCSHKFADTETALGLVEGCREPLHELRRRWGAESEAYLEVSTNVAAAALTSLSATADRSLHAVSGARPSRLAVEHVRLTLHECKDVIERIDALDMDEDYRRHTFTPYKEHIDRMSLTWDLFDNAPEHTHNFQLSNAWGCLFWVMVAGIFFFLKIY